MLNTVAQYQKLKRSKHLLFAYKGVVDKSLSARLLAIVERKLDTVEFDAKTRKKIFNVMVEAVQNVYHNSAENEVLQTAKNDIYILLTRRQHFYEVLSGNFILTEQISQLEANINKVNMMDQTSLRENYIHRLNNGKITKTGRAGLGIMDMVRKSGNKLNYDFQYYDNEYSLFSLKVDINIKE